MWVNTREADMPHVPVCFSRGTAASLQTLPCMPVPDIPACGRAATAPLLVPPAWHHCACWWWLFAFSLTRLLSKIIQTHHQKLPLDSTLHSLPHACSSLFFPPYSAFAVGICCSSHCVFSGSTSAPAVCITATIQAETKSPLQTRS